MNAVSTDHAGEFYASCSNDGRVVVTGLYTEENTHNFKLDKPVQSIAIDPIYARANSGRRYMTAVEDKLFLHEKTFLSRYKQDVICQGEGPISNIKWRGRFAAWVTEKGVRVFDVVDNTTISLIPRPATAPPNSKVPWRIGWGDQFKLLVAFGSTVKVCYIEKRYPVQAGLYKVPKSPPPWRVGKFIKSIGEEYHVVKREGNVMASGKNITWNKGKMEAISSSLYFV